jgi:hypothetical protein
MELMNAVDERDLIRKKKRIPALRNNVAHTCKDVHFGNHIIGSHVILAIFADTAGCRQQREAYGTGRGKERRAA